MSNYAAIFSIFRLQAPRPSTRLPQRVDSTGREGKDWLLVLYCLYKSWRRAIDGYMTLHLLNWFYWFFFTLSWEVCWFWKGLLITLSTIIQSRGRTGCLKRVNWFRKIMIIIYSCRKWNCTTLYQTFWNFLFSEHEIIHYYKLAWRIPMHE